jgi:predicted O-methyltransferase YrrM
MDPLDCLLNKRKNYQTVAKGKNKICEIGFNAGHSLLSMLLVNPNAEYILFDIGLHKYSKLCLEYIKEKFPNTRINIMWGDSRVTLPEYKLLNPNVIFDVVHIDGSHRSEVYSKDWENSILLVSKGSILIFDDTDSVKINAFVDEKIKNGVVNESNNYLETFGYKHRILIKL